MPDFRFDPSYTVKASTSPLLGFNNYLKQSALQTGQTLLSSSQQFNFRFMASYLCKCFLRVSSWILFFKFIKKPLPGWFGIVYIYHNKGDTVLNCLWKVPGLIDRVLALCLCSSVCSWSFATHNIVFLLCFFLSCLFRHLSTSHTWWCWFNQTSTHSTCSGNRCYHLFQLIFVLTIFNFIYKNIKLHTYLQILQKHCMKSALVYFC